MPKEGLPRRLVKITGNMLGFYNGTTGEAKRIDAESLICIDISASDNYPDAPSLVVHPKHGKFWYIDTDFCHYEYLDDKHKRVADNSDRTLESNHSER